MKTSTSFRILLRTTALSLCSAAAFELTGCDRPATPQSPVSPSPAPSVPTTPPTPTTSDAVKPGYDPTQVKLTEAERRAAELKVARQVFQLAAPTADPRANLVFSPASFGPVLEALWFGTRGETAQEIAPLFAGTAVQQPDATTGTPPSQAKGGAEFRAAASLWAPEQHPLLPAYGELVQQRLGISVSTLKPGAPEAVDQINKWASEATGGRITSLMTAGDLRATTRLVAASAAFFKGSWSQPFAPGETRDGDFMAGSGEKVLTALMHGSRRARLGALPDGGQVLELAFTGGGQRLLVLLPGMKAGAAPLAGLAELESQISAESIGKWTGSLTENDVDILLPRFEVRASAKLPEALAALGVRRIFDEKAADLSGLSAAPGLYLSTVKQEAFLRVDEAGAEAGAATVAVVEAKEMKAGAVTFHATRPFLALLLDGSGRVQIIARVSSPAGAPSQAKPSPAQQNQ